MAQFDVYANPSRNSRRAFPFLVDIQNPVICDIATRIVIPLGKLESFNNEMMKGLTPEVEYRGERFLLLTPQLASMAAKSLRNPLGSLSHFREEIIASIDFAITGT